MVHHRSRAFKPIMLSVRTLLREAFRTKNEVLMMAGTGTGACESAIVNVLSPGETVLCVSAGHFGETWARMARHFGCDVHCLSYMWGKQPDPIELNAKLLETGAKVVTLVHSETSTGAVCDLEALLRVCNKHGAVSIVDAISSVGAVPLETDRWGADVVVGASQKGLMTPPGLGLVSVSERAWAKREQSTMPRFYWDWNELAQFQERNDTPFTAAVPTIVGLETALRLLLDDEGLGAAHRRHSEMGEACRQGVKALGMRVWSPDDPSSAVLTAVEVGDADQFVEHLETRFGVIVAPGHGGLGKTMFRIGHIGYMTPMDIRVVLDAILKSPSRNRRIR
jgi:aspartate aminotransferase-like enzyme